MVYHVNSYKPKNNNLLIQSTDNFWLFTSYSDLCTLNLQISKYKCTKFLYTSDKILVNTTDVAVSIKLAHLQYAVKF